MPFTTQSGWVRDAIHQLKGALHCCGLDGRHAEGGRAPGSGSCAIRQPARHKWEWDKGIARLGRMNVSLMGNSRGRRADGMRKSQSSDAIRAVVVDSECRMECSEHKSGAVDGVFRW